ncbi:MAG: hypothetical protein HY097_09115 [Nitrospinae bacterium]|nr:hypothetical protein [Nitrospinota bacterium]MBI3814336.1 hypothetical protein [Nitrospinota bacterium]
MKIKIIIISIIVCVLSVSTNAAAIEVAPRITDREIIEKLTRLEEAVEKSLRAEIKANAEAIKQLREDMKSQFDRIDTQFNRLAAIFTALVAAVIGFAIWDRRTMIRPFETKVKEIEDEIGGNRTKLHSLLDALRTLSETDGRVAEVLKRHNLL